MTASELEKRIVEAEKDPALIRPLIDDFKAHKDGQVSALTLLVNAAPKQSDLDAAIAERDAAIAKCEAILAKVNDGAATKEDIIAEAEKDDKARKVEELTKERMSLLLKATELAGQIEDLSKQ
jgi:hypothetical protein